MVKNRIFGEIRMTWLRLILFALISGIVTGLIALWVPDGISFRQIAVTFEAWIVLAIIVIVNCDKPLEAACKTFVYFLISQPLVYLIQVPFNRMGWGLFGYYKYWFCWTIATFPGAFIAWFIKRDDVIASLILSVATAMLVFFGCGYLRDMLIAPPRFLVSTLFCFGSVPALILGVLHKRNPRFIAAGIAALALIFCLFFQFRGGMNGNRYAVSFGLDKERYPVTEEWTVRLEDPENGTVSLFIGDDVILSTITVSINDPNQPSGIILTDPDGKEHFFSATFEKDGNGFPIVTYETSW